VTNQSAGVHLARNLRMVKCDNQERRMQGKPVLGLAGAPSAPPEGTISRRKL
jgi:hypothetical protein